MQGLQRSTLFVLTLSLGLLVAPVAADTPTTPRNNKIVVVDVAMNANGLLEGQLVDASGQTIDDAQITVWRQDRQLGAMMTGKDGRFQIQGLQGGLYRLDCPGNSVMCRVWQNQIAPPTAKAGLVMVTGDSVVRGQYGCFDPVCTTALVLGIAGVTLSAITLAKIDDLESDNQAIRDDIQDLRDDLNVPASP